LSWVKGCGDNNVIATLFLFVMTYPCELISAAQLQQLAKPARAVVNSECAFVADTLRKQGHNDLAKEYWSWVCSSASKDPVVGKQRFGADVYEQYMQLRAIDAQQTMPSWGTYGT
jgi:hypothetical protein